MLGMSTGSILRALVGRVLVPLAFLMIAAALAGGAQAQAPGDKSAKPQTTLAEPATREAVRELISELDDQQIRTLLVDRLTKEVDQRAARLAEQETQGIVEMVRHYIRAFGLYVSDAVAKLPRIPDGVAKAWSN